MKRLSKVFVVVTIAQAASAAQAPPAVELTRKLTSSTEVYKLTKHENRVMSSEYFDEMEFDTTMNATVRIETGKIDEAKGEAETRILYTVDSQETDGPTDGLEAKPKPVNLHGVLDRYGRFVSDDAKAKIEEARAKLAVGPLQSGILTSLPDQPVSVGQTWTVSVPYQQAPGQEPQSLKAKLVGTETIDGKEVWLVATSGTVKLLTEEKLHFELKGKPLDQTMSETEIVNVEGKAWVEKASGRTIRAESKVSTKLTIVIEPGKAKVEGKYSVKYSAALADSP